MSTINPNNPTQNFSLGSTGLKVHTGPIVQHPKNSQIPVDASPKASTESAIVSEESEVKERYHQLLNDALAILTQTSFTEKDSAKLQGQLKELESLQNELTPTTTQSLRSLNETLSAGYTKVTGEDFINQEIPPEILEQVVKTPIMLENQFQSTTVSDEAQRISDEEMLNNLQNQLQNTQEMVDNLNAQIAEKMQLFGPDGDGNEVSKEIQELKNQILQLQEQNQKLTDQISAAQAQIKTQNQIDTYLKKILDLLNTNPVPEKNSQAFRDLFNNTIQTRDQLQTFLSNLDKNDPNYALAEKALNDLLVAYPYATYPTGVTATTTGGVIDVYTKKSNFNELIAKAYYKAQFTPDFISNFIKFINGDTLDRPILDGKPMTDQAIKMGKDMYFDAIPTAVGITVINKPDGGTIDTAIAIKSLSDLKKTSKDINDAISANQSAINSNQAIIDQNQGAINANTQNINTDESHLQELLNAQMAKINELMKNNKDLKDVIDRLNGIVTTDPNDTTTFSINRLIACLIDLCQVMQGMAAAETARLAIVTKKMSAYSKLLLQIPVLSSQDYNNKDTRNEYNQLYANAAEGVRINKSAEEDLAKQIQTILQSLKDAAQSIEDFIGTTLNLMASISQKISR